MNILFVSSGNSKRFDIIPFIKSQGESLKENGININYFSVSNSGVIGYLKSIRQLKRYLKSHRVDLIHAHFTLCGWVSVLTFSGIPVILSVMGTDAYGRYIGYKKVELISRLNTLLTYLIQPFVKAIISKSKNIEAYIYRKKISYIIPNGVQINHFKPSINKQYDALKLNDKKQYVLFLGDRKHKRKNFPLVASAVSILNDPNVELLTPYPINQDKVIQYLNTVDVLVMSSFMEGSPNVIKEAMACNCPIVATDVGDVKWLMNDVKGCYLTSFESDNAAQKLRMAIEFSKNCGRTNGRDRILNLNLDAESVANKIVSIYKSVSPTY